MKYTFDLFYRLGSISFSYMKLYSYAATGLSASAESVKRPSLRRTSSREKQRLHRSSSRRNKENGAKARVEAARSLETMKTKIVRVVTVEQQPVERKMLDNSREIIEEQRVAREHARVHQHSAASGDGTTIGPQDCTEMDVQTFHVTLTYKPRI